MARVAWYGANSNNMTHPVGQKEANTFGLYDMHGNVWQWCQDWFDENYYGKSEAENPQGSYPDYRDEFIGFRDVVVPSFRTP